MVGNIVTPTHLLFVLVVALLVLGPKRLPAAGRGLGEAMRGFKDALASDGRSDPSGRQIYEAHQITEAIDAAGAAATSQATAPPAASSSNDEAPSAATPESASSSPASTSDPVTSDPVTSNPVTSNPVTSNPVTSNPV